MILVTAATAPVGRSIVEQLVAAGRPVRALTREPARAGLPAGAEVVAGDLSDAASLPAAMAGVEAIFLLAVVPGFAPAFLAAAREAGVRRVVFQSSGAIEDGAAEQPNDVAAPADLAAVAVAALTDGGHAGRTYRVTGPESLTHREQAQRLGRALGRPLRYEEITPAEARKAMGPYAPADVLLADWAAHSGRPAPVTDTVEKVTGRPGRGFAEYVTDHADDFR